LLDVARRQPQGEFEKRARERVVTFAHVSTTPERFRGHPVFLHGHVRRMTEIRPISNSEGIDRIYEGWLFTEESQDNPYAIIVSELPRDFPLGGNIVEDVSFAGYFLKLWAYRAGDDEAKRRGTWTMRYAPLLVGHRVVWHPRPKMIAPDQTTHAVIFAMVGGLVLALIAVAWYARRSAVAIRRMYASAADRPTPGEVQAIGESAAPSTEELLATMEQQAREATDESSPRE
jgi:hypothetical protein